MYELFKDGTLKAVLLPSLAKVFMDESPASQIEAVPLSGLRGEVVSFQVALWAPQAAYPTRIKMRADAPTPFEAQLRQVASVPVRYGAPLKRDDDYIRTQPGLYPDLLQPLPEDGQTIIVPGEWSSFWVDVRIPQDCPAGDYTITVAAKMVKGEGATLVQAHLSVLPAELPKQKLICTIWFHCDGLAQYYDVDVFSERHWALMEEQVGSAVRLGSNMLYTPLFTPPLDTTVDGERLTVQLVDMTEQDGIYAFNFDKLQRWVQMAKRQGVEYFEMTHLFTQWGGVFTPKIIVNGEKRFGWHVRADDPSYKAFLDQFLPALTAQIKELGIAHNTIFHISDEPHGDEQAGTYKVALDLVAPHLQDFDIYDALSDFSFYEKGLIQHPIPANDAMDPFLEAKVPGLWTYYCVAQAVGVANRFITMPSSRSRVLAAQLYKYQIEGFLQWGFNFYNAQFSIAPIDPVLSADAGGGFPAGDPFIVYPGRDGKPMESIRYMVFREAMQDLRAMQLLQDLAGRDKVLELIEQDKSAPLAFDLYPRGARYVLSLREKVNQAIKEALIP